VGIFDLLLLVGAILVDEILVEVKPLFEGVSRLVDLPPQ